MVGQLLTAKPVIAIVFGNAAIFHRGLKWVKSGQQEAYFA